ncbi:MAG TPA: MBL fold metallo-hydrolase [Smithella sp.]|nr:MBL fold metallo-hydrolase [Smithella sp.]HQI73946.1 MBL fold metallo-hydrolase [Smithella sp.]
MKIKFLGAAREVTGSCFVIETDQARFAVDCGMHQGGSDMEARNWDTHVYDPKNIDFFLITHAHIDHSGLLPRMVQNGFKGPVYATEPSGDLIKILLLDSAHIQETDSISKTRRLQRNGKAETVVPLYSTGDAEAVAPLIKTKRYNEVFTPANGIKVNFQDAGHILGAAILELYVEENGSSTKLVFSGDIGRRHQLLMKDPVDIHDADFLFMESTYGDRDHKGEEDSLNEMSEAIQYSYSRNEKIIIPAFAVERTQEILYSLYLLNRDGRLPKDIPVILDSPLAIKATEIFRKYRSYLDAETHSLLKEGEDPLDLPQLQFSSSTEQSMKINEMKGSAIVISASGMANAGRIRHHLRHNLWRPGASIVFVGFQAQGTPGRKIIEGAKKIRIFNEDIAVKAKIWTIGGFSAHAGQSQLLEWLSNFSNKEMPVFLIHGEPATQDTLALLIKQKLGFDITIPDYLEEINIRAGRKPEAVKQPPAIPQPVDIAPLLSELKAKIDDLSSQMGHIQSLPASRQIEFLNLIRQAKLSMDEIKIRDLSARK